MQIRMNFYLSKPVFDSSELDLLHELIVELLPDWAVGLEVLENEDVLKGSFVGKDGSLFDAVKHEVGHHFSLGIVELKGAHPNINFYLDSCATTLPPELNHISVELLIPDNGTRIDFSLWSTFFQGITAQLSVRYARACEKDEFYNKNMITDRQVRAIGVHLEQSLPGLYWLNYFGAPYVRLIGRDRLNSAPARSVIPVSDGFFMALDSDPLKWDTEEYKAREELVIEHIGKRYFFSRAEPDRETIAPNFQ